MIPTADRMTEFNRNVDTPETETVMAHGASQRGDVDLHRLVSALERIASAVEAIANCTDEEKRTVRMMDTERANVYKTHLGQKLRPESEGR